MSLIVDVINKFINVYYKNKAYYVFSTARETESTEDQLYYIYCKKKNLIIFIQVLISVGLCHAITFQIQNASASQQNNWNTKLDFESISSLWRRIFSSSEIEWIKIQRNNGMCGIPAGEPAY